MAPTEGKKKIARTCRPSFAYINESSPIPDNAENEKALLVYNYEAKNTSSAIRNQWAFIGTTPNAIVLEDIPYEDDSMDSAETAVQSDGSLIIDSEIINEDEGYGTRPHGMKELTGSMTQDEDCSAIRNQWAFIGTTPNAIVLEDIPNEDVSMDSAETAVQSDGSQIIDSEIINEDEGYGTRPHGMKKLTGSMMQDEDCSAIRNQWAFIGTTPNAIKLEDIPNEDVSMDSAETAVQSDGSLVIDSEIINEDEGYGTRPHGMKKLTGSMMQDEDCAIKLEDIPNEDVSMDSAETAVQSDGSKIDLEIINEDEGYGTRPHGMTGSMMQDEDCEGGLWNQLYGEASSKNNSGMWSITSQDEIMAPIVQNFVSCYGPAP